jgi:hypothetical protein
MVPSLLGLYMPPNWTVSSVALLPILVTFRLLTIIPIDVDLMRNENGVSTISWNICASSFSLISLTHGVESSCFGSSVTCGSTPVMTP